MINIKTFAKKSAPFILSGIGVIGVIVTVIMSAKAAPKAVSLLENAEKSQNKKLTNLEKTRIAAPIYIPTAVTGSFSLMCLVGSNILFGHKQSSFIGAYPVVRSICYTCKKNGDKHATQKDLDSANQNEEKELFYDFYSGRYFESSRELVLNAETEINRILINDHEASLNEFYDLLDLERLKEYESFGWSSYELARKFSYPWIEFKHEIITIDDTISCEEMECIAINMEPNPFILKVE